MLISAGRTLRIHRNYGKSIEVDVEEVDLGQRDAVSGVSWSGTGTTVALVGKKWDHVSVFSCDGNNIYDEQRIPIQNSMYQNCCVLSKRGDLLYTSGVLGTVYIWQCANNSWTVVGELGSRSRTTVSTIALDPAEQFICTGDTKGRVIVFERLPSSEAPGALPASSYKPGTILSSSSSEEISVLQCNPYHPHQPSELAVGHNSGLLEVWDLPSKTLRYRVHSHSATITDIAYSTINGQLMVTSGLDGEVNILLVMSGAVVKKCNVEHPVHSVEFVKGTQQLLYLTDTAIVTYSLNKSWSLRVSEPVTGASLLRFQHSRAPLYETKEAYLARSGGVNKNTANANPNKPSPDDKTPRDVTSSSRDVAELVYATPDGSEFRKTPTSGSASLSRDVITAPRDVITTSRDTPRSIDVINEEESGFDLSKDGDSLFHISDLVNYSQFDTPESTSKKRSVPEDKENLPPNIFSQDFVAPGGIKKRAGLVSSTPATQTEQINRQYLTPTSYNLTNRHPLSHVKRFKRLMQPKITSDDHKTRNSFKPITTPPVTSDVTTLSCDVITPSCDVIEPKESRDGISTSFDLMSIQSSGRAGLSGSSLFSPVDRAAKSHHEHSSIGVIQNKLTPSYTSNTGEEGRGNGTPSNYVVNTQSGCGPANPTDNVGAMSESQVEAIVARQFKQHQKTLLSETRWLKNEIVNQAVQTQFALEDILKVVLERLGNLEQRVSNVEQSVEQVLQNM